MYQVAIQNCIEKMYIARFQTWCKHLPLDAIKTEVHVRKRAIKAQTCKFSLNIDQTSNQCD